MRLKYHPVRIFTILTLAGITSLFITLSVLYFISTYNADVHTFKLPMIFHANTMLLLVSSYSMNETRKAIVRDDWAGYSRGLLVTCCLGIIFTIFQIVGWGELMNQGILLSNNLAASYLYLISGLHLVHLIVGVGLISLFLVQAWGKSRNQVEALLFETDPFRKLQVEMLALYWNFVDLLWIYIYLFFIINIYVLNI